MVIIHRSMFAIGDVPLSTAEGLRPAFRGIFCNRRWLEDFDADRTTDTSAVPRALRLFIAGLSSFRFDDQRARTKGLTPSDLALEWSRCREGTEFQKQYWREQGEEPPYPPFTPPKVLSYLNVARRLGHGAFGFDEEQKDSRMHYLYLRLLRPLGLVATENGIRVASGYVDVRLHPCGYFELLIRVHVADQKTTSSSRQAVLETRPWRTDGRWKWRSRLANGKLADIVDGLFSQVHRSVGPALYPRQVGAWSSLLAAASPESQADRTAEELIGASTSVFHFEGSPPAELFYGVDDRATRIGGHLCAATVHTGAEGLLLIYPQGDWRSAGRHFRRLATIAGFLTFKFAVYADYQRWLKAELVRLRSLRFSGDAGRLLSSERAAMIAFQETGPCHLATLDRLILLNSPRTRALYSFVSHHMKFSDVRKKLNETVEQWEDVVFRDLFRSVDLSSVEPRKRAASLAPVPLYQLRIFLASPGDVASDRTHVRDTLLGIARGPFVRGRVSVDVVSWDDPHAPALMDARLSPQEAVAISLPTPAQCDLTIVLLWGRMGTPLAQRKTDGTQYLSGTEWELEDALKANKPVLIYRRVEKVLLDPDDADFEDKLAQQRKVGEFFKTFIDRSGAQMRSYKTYASLSELLVTIRQDVEHFLSLALSWNSDLDSQHRN